MIIVHKLLIEPGQTDAESRAYSELAGYYVGPAGGALMTFLFVLCVGRKLTAHFVVNGVLVGLAGVALTVGFIFVAKPEHRLMYVISYIARIAAGYLGGLAARSRFGGMTPFRRVPA